MSSVGVVGGGMLGMTLALRLRAQGHDVTVIEGAATPGGMVVPQTIGGYTWDKFYHVILPSDQHLLALLDELGLARALRWGTTRTGFYTDGKLYSLSSTLEFLRFPPLSLVDKARLALTILRASRVRDGVAMEETLATDWLGRWSGERTLRRIWLPLLKSKLGDAAARASAAFIWAIIARLYAARKSGMKRETFGYVDGGYDAILRRLREHLGARGIEFVCGAPVAEVRETGASAEVHLTSGGLRRFDSVVLTVPSTRIPSLCPQLTQAERARLDGVVYLGIVCASVLLRRPLAGFYVTNITESWVPFTAVVEMTSLVDRARFGGNSLVYLPRYVTRDDPFWHKPDAEVQATFEAALERMYPGFRAANDVLAFQVGRVRDMLALSTLRYSERLLPPTRTSLAGVFVVTSAQIAHGTLNVNETVALANAKARELAPLLATRGVELPADASAVGVAN